MTRFVELKTANRGSRVAVNPARVVCVVWDRNHEAADNTRSCVHLHMEGRTLLVEGTVETVAAALAGGPPVQEETS
jgi:beta-lactamase superfamily II metal-dependent hydrolase